MSLGIWWVTSHHLPATPSATITASRRTASAVLTPYCRRTGRAGIPDFMFFIVFSPFRGAAIAQGIAMRAKIGTASAADAAERGKRARISAKTAWDLAQQR
ncbi:MAG TPA: hypothetical protein VKV03_15930 [Candidatus Binataceae bacterium]|nr:hypothetical protein [Candidatus Binataceae bacterium]